MSGVLEEAGNVLGVAAALVGLGVPLYGGYKYLLSLWSRTYGSRGDLTRRLNRMACGVTLDYVQELLGSPAFRRDLCEGGTRYIELTWRNPHGWICVLVLNQAVAAFAVTVTDPKFAFDCTVLTFEQLPVTLGEAMLADGGRPGRTRVSIGARRFDVTDTYYFGNPGAYQWYGLVFNDSGVGSIVADVAGVDEGDPGDPNIERVRRGTTANTLVVGGPNSDVLSAWFYPGVDMDFVRTLRSG